jgi:hypothetical protein
MARSDHDPRSLDSNPRRRWVVVAFACIIGFAIGLLGMSYFGAQRGDDAAASQGLPEATRTQDRSGQPRATTGTHVPPAAAQPQR